MWCRCWLALKGEMSQVCTESGQGLCELTWTWLIQFLYTYPVNHDILSYSRGTTITSVLTEARAHMVPSHHCMRKLGDAPPGPSSFRQAFVLP